jgi:universal stress protein A
VRSAPAAVPLRALLGTLSALHSGSCLIEVLRPLTGTRPMNAIHTVVTAIDFDQSANDAIDMARELVRPRRGRLHLLHVVPDVLHTPWMVQAAGVDFELLQQRWRDDAWKQLRAFVATQRLDPGGLTTAVVVGAPHAEIVRYASEHAADAIVLGSHGHSSVRRFVLGSVADRVIRQASCPVLVVPRRSPPPAEQESNAATGIEA